MFWIFYLLQKTNEVKNFLRIVLSDANTRLVLFPV